MSRFHSYINSAIEILKTYKGEEPFAGFLKKYFGEHKKFGSRDRKQVSQLCYCFFRLGRLNNGAMIDEILLQGLFLCLDGPNEILGELKPEWNDKMG
jgi:16S rRNA (cytosine967-C5)-methyltransferase